MNQTQEMTEFIKACLREDSPHAFYTCSAWLKTRAEILASDHHECQLCKARGIHTRAELVHHVKHLRNYPELGLSRFYLDEEGKEQRNLISVCKDCHETVCHPERLRKKKSKPLTAERWD